MQTIKVVFLITDLLIGGAERALTRTAVGLSKHGYNVSVAYLYEAAPMAEVLKNAGVSVINLKMRNKFNVTAFWRFYRLLRYEQPQILHTYMFHADLMGRLVGRLAGVPIIISSRRNINIGGQLREVINRFTVRLSDVTTAVCDQVRKTEIKQAGVEPERVVRIYNGVEIEKFQQVEKNEIANLKQALSISPDDMVLGMVSSFREQKGYSFLIQAMVEIISAFPRVKLLLVGDGVLREHIEKIVKTAGLTNAVIFTGIRRGIPDILSAMDIFVLSSLWEGMPNVVLEAMAAGLPVIATSVGGIPEAVIDGQTGLLVPPGNTGALAKAVIDLLNNPERASEMGLAGKKRADEFFSVSAMIGNTEALYEKWIQKKLS